MGPPDNTKIALGVVAATGVVVVSYILVKKLGFQGKSGSLPQDTREEEEELASSSAAFEPELISETSGNQASKPPQGFTSEGATGDVSGYLDDQRKEPVGDDGQNQTSFIVIDSGEGVGLSENENHLKKCDRSSDESSYDVIEEDRLAESVDDGEGEGTEPREIFYSQEEEKEKSEDKKVEADPNETSMVVIDDSDRSALEQSSSSFYASADENLGLSQSEGDKNSSGERKEEEDASVTDEEKTVMFSGDQKSVSDKENVSSEERVVEMEPDQAESGQGETPSEPSDITSPDVQSKLQTIAITDAVLRADLQSVPPPLGTDDNQSSEKPSPEEITEVLTTCQNNPTSMNKDEINLLVGLLRQRIPELHSTVLDSLVRISAFTQNMTNLRDSGCPELIATLVKEKCEEVIKGETDAYQTLNRVCQVLTNFSMDPKTHPPMQTVIPALIDVLLMDSVSDNVQLSTLRPLINLSSQNDYHDYYIRLIAKLYTMVDSGVHMVKVQSLKVLVNLSLDVKMVPHLLSAKAPTTLLDLLGKPTPTDIIMRTVTVLANIHVAIHEGELTLASLPVDEKAPSPETMYTALTGVDRVPTLRSKVFNLTRHEDEDVSYQASKLYKYMTEKTEEKE